MNFKNTVFFFKGVSYENGQKRLFLQYFTVQTHTKIDEKSFFFFAFLLLDAHLGLGFAAI